MECKFKAGVYYVGDLCYVVNNDNWRKLLEDTDYFQNDIQLFKGEQIFASGTAYGDGTYTDNLGREYDVDAGIIGIMPVSVLDENGYGNGGQIIEFTEDFNVKENNGIFYIGNIVINTKDEEDDEDDTCDNNELDNDYFGYLDDLRDSGITNMFGAVPYLLNTFSELTEDEARDILKDWMKTYSERHK